MPVGIVTGASRGLGLALTRALVERGWRLVVDARGRRRARARVELRRPRDVVIPGDVADPAHRQALVEAAGDRSTCSSTTPACSARARCRRSPTIRSPSCAASTRSTSSRRSRSSSSRCPGSSPARAVLNVTSDAAVEPYEGWGGYGSSKAALEQLTAILAAEHPELRVYAVDPGDMRTQMQQDAFPGEDISDRPPPEESVPGLLALIEGSLPSGRYRAARAGRSRGMSALLEVAVRHEAHEPPEARGLGRDDVRDARRDAAATGGSSTRASASCPASCPPGDLLVVNTSATLPAALDGAPRRAARSSSGFRPRLDGREPWVVELRTSDGAAVRGDRRGARLELPGGATRSCSRPTRAANASPSRG